MHSHQLVLESQLANQVEKESLTGTIVTHHQPEYGPAIRYGFNTADHGLYFRRTTNLDVLDSLRWNDTGAKRPNHCLSHPWTNLHFYHLLLPRTTPPP